MGQKHFVEHQVNQLLNFIQTTLLTASMTDQQVGVFMNIRFTWVCFELAKNALFEIYCLEHDNVHTALCEDQQETIFTHRHPEFAQPRPTAIKGARWEHAHIGSRRGELCILQLSMTRGFWLARSRRLASCELDQQRTGS